MKNLQKEFLETLKLIEKEGDDFLYNSQFKKSREIWIIGSFYNLLRASEEFCDVWFEEKEKPDFNLISQTMNCSYGVEVTETLHMGRERGNESSKQFDINKWLFDMRKNNTDPWSTLFEVINKKLNKKYPLNTDLVVYLNIPISHLNCYGFWINLVCQKILDSINANTICFNDVKFRRIYILNSGGTELLRIFPNFDVIYSPYQQYFHKSFSECKWSQNV